MRTSYFITLCFSLLSLTAFAPQSLLADDPLTTKERYRGLSVGQWVLLQNEYVFGENLGDGSDIPNPYKNVLLLPESIGQFVPYHEVSVSEETALVVPFAFFVGEVYVDGTYDTPEQWADFFEEYINTTALTVKLDGETIVDGFYADLSEYFVGPEYYNNPIMYTEPQDREGFPQAAGAIWAIVAGTVLPPLDEGEHTIEIIESSIDSTETITYRIFVNEEMEEDDDDDDDDEEQGDDRQRGSNDDDRKRPKKRRR